MSKYIIEIEDVPFSKVRVEDDGVQNINLYRAKGFNSLVFDKEGLDKLTPLDMINKDLKEAYRCGLDDAWELARRLVWETSLNEAKSMGFIAEEDTAKILRDYTVTAAMKAVELYDKKLKSEIKVGDEVEAHSGKAIVFYASIDSEGNKFCRYWYPSEDRFDMDNTKNLKKTGLHFPQVAELIEIMKGKQSEQRSCSTCKYYDGSDVSKCSDCYIPKGYSMWEPKEGAE